MNERIEKLIKKTVSGKMYVNPVKTEYDRCDLFLPPIKMSCKRVCEYIRNQEPLVLPETCLTGLIVFDGSVEGDIFGRSGHANFAAACSNFYNKPVDNLLTFEWQHSAGDFGKIINGGIIGIKEEIEKSIKNHAGDEKAVQFLETQSDICDALIDWAEKCSKKALTVSKATQNPKYKSNLERLSKALKIVPKKPAANFYEAVLSLYISYSLVPDSIGLIDRYLYPFYKKDTESGYMSRDEAAGYLQELFLMLQARIHISSDRFYRGGESHFCVGGYLENGEDGFNELSKLIVDSLMELPTWIPQISLRRTSKTPHEVLRYMMDCERKDANKRIAFVNDEPRIKGLMKYTGLSYKKAVNYTMIGCNEIALPGGIVFGFDPMNIVRCVQNTLFDKSDDIIKAKTFDDFYDIFQEEGVDNAIWIFNPNAEDCPPAHWNSYVSYYPGDNYVQLIGLTGYNTGEYYKELYHEKWRTFDEIYKEPYDKYMNVFGKFPFIITEFASSSVGGDKAAWITDMFAQIKKYENVRAALWWSSADYDMRPETYKQLARPYFLDETEDTTAAFREGIKSYKK